MGILGVLDQLLSWSGGVWNYDIRRKVVADARLPEAFLPFFDSSTLDAHTMIPELDRFEYIDLTSSHSLGIPMCLAT